ncbi:MAG: class I SAM-dependent methyltransferase [Thermoplasmata archaeon]
MYAEEAPDTDWVSHLADAPRDQARQYVQEAADDTVLFRHLSREHRSGGRSFYIEIEAPLELYALARLLRPAHVVEVGVSSGVSSAYFLRALERNGHGTLHSVDRPKPEGRRRPGSSAQGGSWSIPAGRSSGWAVPFSLRKRWDLRLGDKAEVLPLLAEELDRIDLFLYDVPHGHPQAFREFSVINPRFHRGSVALADHGGTHEICSSLRSWARMRKTTPRLRRGLGLGAFRFP